GKKLSRSLGRCLERFNLARKIIRNMALIQSKTLYHSVYKTHRKGRFERVIQHITTSILGSKRPEGQRHCFRVERAIQ
ncbi:pipo, partial [Potato virus Y strain C]